MAVTLPANVAASCAFCVPKPEEGTDEFYAIYKRHQGFKIPGLPLGFVSWVDLYGMLRDGVQGHYLLVSRYHVPSVASYTDQDEFHAALRCFAQFLVRKHRGCYIFMFEHGADNGAAPCGIRHLHVHGVLIECSRPFDQVMREVVWLLAEQRYDFKKQLKLISIPGLFENLHQYTAGNGYLHMGVYGASSPCLIIETKGLLLPSQSPRIALGRLVGEPQTDWTSFRDGLVPQWLREQTILTVQQNLRLLSIKH